MNFSGSIDGMDLAGVFQMFESQALTGTFKIESHDELFSFEIVNGALGDASCKSRELRRRINRYLYWAIGTKQVFRNYLVPTTGNPFSSMGNAYKSGLIKQKHYIQAFNYFRQEMFLETFRKPRGNCSFTPHQQPNPGPSPLPINHLLMESMTVIDDLRRKRKDVPADTFFKLTEEALSIINQHKKSPSPFERPAFHLAEKMRHPIQLENLVFHSFLHRDHIIRILFGMKKKGWINLETIIGESRSLNPFTLPNWTIAAIWLFAIGIGLVQVIQFYQQTIN